MNKYIDFYRLLIFKKFYLFILWFFILSGVNLNIEYLILDNNENILNWLYSFRAYIQIIILVFLIHLNLKLFKNLKRINYFFILFFLYNLIQILSLTLSENNNLNIIYNITSINLLLFLNIIFYNENYEIKKIFYFLILTIAIIYFYFYFEKIYYLIFTDQLFYGHYGEKALIAPIQNIPRSSGIGRMALILFLFSVIFLNLKNKKNLLLISIFIIPGIFLTQSRTIVGIYFIVLMVITFSNYVNLNNLKIKNFKYNFIYFIIIPLIFSISLAQLKSSNLLIIKSFLFKQIFDKEIKIDRNYTKYRVLRKVSPASITSYRFNDWKELIKLTIKSSPIIGNGAQSDRFLIKQTASNGLIYFFSSAGVLGIFIFIMIYFQIIKILSKNVKYLRINNLKDKNYIFAFFIIFILSMRSIVESSYAVFSIDYIFFIISLYLIANNDKKNQS